MCECVQAFLAASLKTDDELLDWFNERLVWNDQSVVSEMLKNGLFVRIFAPQVSDRIKKHAAYAPGFADRGPTSSRLGLVVRLCCKRFKLFLPKAASHDCWLTGLQTQCAALCVH